MEINNCQKDRNILKSLTIFNLTSVKPCYIIKSFIFTVTMAEWSKPIKYPTSVFLDERTKY